MTLGTVQLGMEYGISNSTGKPDRKESFSILDKAMEGGVNSFDTALAYGDSEAVLGDYFSRRALENKDYTITTKFAFKDKKSLSEKEIEAQVNEFVNKSLLQLKQDKLQIVMLHHYEDLEHYGTKLVDVMKKIKSRGLTDKIGVSVHNPYTIKDVIGYGAFDAIQAPMNILDTRIPESGVLKELKKEEMIVFIRSVFLQGLIFKDESSALPPNIECARPYLSKLRDIAERENIGIAELAMAYVRDLPGVTSLVVGCETKSQVEQNIVCINTPSLSQETVREIQEAFADVPEAVINPMKWTVG
jgi:aryl-alcohol dehydrogenase-like predicted oxidoreductase